MLPYNRFSPKWVYTTKDVTWDGEAMDNKVPFKNNKKDSDSRLPLHGDKYPWLSIGNFLEDKIIELPYSIDSSKFEMCGSDKYLLPLTKTFFNYFETSKVKQLFKFHQLAAGVEVELKIPVKGGNIEYKKIYNQTDIVKLRISSGYFTIYKS